MWQFLPEKDALEISPQSVPTLWRTTESVTYGLWLLCCLQCAGSRKQRQELYTKFSEWRFVGALSDARPDRRTCSSAIRAPASAPDRLEG
jgi:hypothetical protein